MEVGEEGDYIALVACLRFYADTTSDQKGNGDQLTFPDKIKTARLYRQVTLKKSTKDIF